MHAQALSQATGMYSKDSAGSGRERPCNTFSSCPSTSILQKVGSP